jgi:predicted nucleic acid-binding protein
MNAVFADTFYWIAFTNAQDDAHEKAKEFTLSAKPGAIYTTEEVLTEYLNYFAGWGPRFRGYAATNVQNMRGNQTVHIIPQTAASFEAGVTLYRARLDKGYSLTDCISMYTMKNVGLAEVLTNDVHFEQEGFRALLRAS